jgi:protein-S-isoprenylcysteine O-methyltransferase Ste14
MIIVFAWATFLLYWVISAPGRNFKEKLPNLVLALALLIAVTGIFLLLSAGGVSENLNLVIWQETLFVGLCADVVVLLSLYVLIWARRILGSNWSSNVSAKRSIRLVQNGPYAYVRHPIYTGLIGIVLGTSIAYGHLMGILIFLLCTIGLYIKALREESVLTGKFHSDYLAYKARTKALIPFLL